MRGFTTYHLITTMNNNALNFLGLKNKTQPFVAYKKHTPLTKTNIDLERKVRKRYSKQTQPESKLD
jgi:hypothetical protein